MGYFQPTRLRLARMRRGLSKQELVERLGADPKTLFNYEAGNTEPDDDALGKLANALHFPVEFFVGDPVQVPDAKSAYFRATTKMTAPQRDAALAAGGLAILFSKWMDKRFELAAPTLPEVEEDIGAASAAMAVRAEWGLGDRPVSSMVHLLESHGVRVFSLVKEAEPVDAFSLWADGRPLVFLDTTKSAERCRFDAAHELAHLVLHRAQASHSREQEQEAHEFAACFLMPESAIVALGRVPSDLASLNLLKRRWKVALSALVVRLGRMKMLSEWHYRSLIIEIGQLGYRTNEPEPRCPHETSQLLLKILQLLGKEKTSLPAVATELAIPVEELRGLMFGLAPVRA